VLSDGSRVRADLVDSLDQTWDQLSARLQGLTDGEYVWEPAAGCWNVHTSLDGPPRVDWIDPAPDPAPLTTIAWRLWHIAVDCLDSYSERRFGRRGTGLTGTSWTLEVVEAKVLLDQAWHVFRDPFTTMSLEDLMVPLGEAWGRYARHSTLALALHANREVTHHAAEVALLRDLYRVTG